MLGLVAVTATFLAGLVLERVAKARNAKRFPERVAQLAGSPDCPKCGSGDAIPVLSNTKVCCPECGEPELRVEMVGIS